MGLRNSLRESEEEKAKREKESEERQKEFEESKSKRKADLEKSIKEIKQRDLVKYALKILNELSDQSYEGFSPEIQSDLEYSDKAEKIAKYILKKKKSRLQTSKELTMLAFQLTNFADLSDMKINSFPENNEPPEYENIRNPAFTQAQLKKLFPNIPRKESPNHSPQYPENKPLRELAKKINVVSDKYLNTHFFNENSRFTNDDDQKATPYNFFSMRRIKEYLLTLPDEPMKYRYLLQMKEARFNKDKRGFIKQNGKDVLKEDEDFLRDLDHQISIYGKTSETLQKPKTVEDTLRRKVILLIMLLFGNLECPQEVINERIIEFIHQLIGGDITKIRKIVRNPTAHKGTKQSVKYLCDDLNFVRDSLGKLGKTENLLKIIHEIDFSISELDEI